MRGIDVAAPDSQGKAGEGGGGLPDGAKLLVFPGLPQKMTPNLVFSGKKKQFRNCFQFSHLLQFVWLQGAGGVGYVNIAPTAADATLTIDGNSGFFTAYRYSGDGWHASSEWGMAGIDQ